MPESYTVELYINGNDLSKVFASYSDAHAYVLSYLNRVGPDDWMSLDLCRTLEEDE